MQCEEWAVRLWCRACCCSCSFTSLTCLRTPAPLNNIYRLRLPLHMPNWYNFLYLTYALKILHACFLLRAAPPCRLQVREEPSDEMDIRRLGRVNQIGLYAPRHPSVGQTVAMRACGLMVSGCCVTLTHGAAANIPSHMRVAASTTSVLAYIGSNVWQRKRNTSFTIARSTPRI